MTNPDKSAHATSDPPAVAPAQSDAPNPPTAGAAATGGQSNSSFTYSPTTNSAWIRPGYAVWVVVVVALALLGVVVVAVLNLTVGEGVPPTSDPNGDTIAALASAAIAALTSLTAAYFGIKVAGEQATQANVTAAMALEVASKISANSTTNGNPKLTDF